MQTVKQRIQTAQQVYNEEVKEIDARIDLEIKDLENSRETEKANLADSLVSNILAGGY